jgi:hypothetical protein
MLHPVKEFLAFHKLLPFNLKLITHFNYFKSDCDLILRAHGLLLNPGKRCWM